MNKKPKYGTRACSHCGKQMALAIKRDVGRKHYCGSACRQRGRYAKGEFTWMKRMQELGRSADKRPTKSKLCEACGKSYVPLSARQRWCLGCVPDRAARGRMQRYGLTEMAFSKFFDAQQGCCSICGAALTKSSANVDHDHRCCPGAVTCGKCLRGLLCCRCNSVLPNIENRAWLSSALSYLEM